MTKYRFTKTDFDVFTIDGLEPRMEALVHTVRPKLNNLGEHFAGFLTELTGDEHHAHVAKHLRRKVNPPDDTWVSFSTNPRGYKMLPHFQIGLFVDHAFCMYGVIYESKSKAEVARKWLDNIDMFREFDEDFYVSLDHMKPDKVRLADMTREELEAGLKRAIHTKKGEFLIGNVYSRKEIAALKEKTFIADLESVMESLVRLY